MTVKLSYTNAMPGPSWSLPLDTCSGAQGPAREICDRIRQQYDARVVEMDDVIATIKNEIRALLDQPEWLPDPCSVSQILRPGARPGRVHSVLVGCAACGEAGPIAGSARRRSLRIELQPRSWYEGDDLTSAGGHKEETEDPFCPGTAKAANAHGYLDRRSMPCRT